MGGTTTPLPPPSRVTSCSKGMDPAVHGMMKTMLAEKAAARAAASANKVKAEPGSNAPGFPSLYGEKRGLEEADGEEPILSEKAAAPASAKKRIREEAHSEEEEVPHLSVPSTPLSGVCSPPPGFSWKPQHIVSRHDGDTTTDWEAARERLQGAVSTPLERVFAAKEPSDVVASSYKAILQAANYASFSFRYALELEEKLVAREREAAALREQLEDVKAQLAAAKEDLPTAGPELEKAERAGEAEAELVAARAEAVKKRAEVGALKRAAEAEAQRRAEHALERYERWRGRQAPAGRAA